MLVSVLYRNNQLDLPFAVFPPCIMKYLNSGNDIAIREALFFKPCFSRREEKPSHLGAAIMRLPGFLKLRHFN